MILADFPSGEVSDILLGFHNEGPDFFVVTAIDGAYRAPHDTAHYLQNVSRTVAPCLSLFLILIFLVYPLAFESNSGAI